MTNSKPLFFVHIPKTGGTSFRLAAEAYFGEDNLIYDYGKKSKKTSDVIHDYCYKNDDLYGLSQALSKSGTKMIAGHMPAAKFSPIVGIGNTVCFIRDPAEQLISHYRHYKRDHGYNGTFAEFANHPSYNSIQSRMLKKIEIEAFGFLALTECFQSSMELLNEQYGLSLPELNLNVTGEKEHEKTVVTDEMRDIAIKKTQEERVLYDKISNLLSRRKIARKQGHAFVHGTVTALSSRGVSGFAFVPGSDSAVQVHLDLNGETASEPKPAQLFRPILAAYKVERNGFVGFVFKTPKLMDGDIISCIATETEQVLWNVVWGEE